MRFAHERDVEVAHALAGLMRADAARVARWLLLALRVHLDLLRATPQLGGAALGRHEVARLELVHDLVRVRVRVRVPSLCTTWLELELELANPNPNPTPTPTPTPTPAPTPTPTPNQELRERGLAARGGARCVDVRAA